VLLGVDYRVRLVARGVPDSVTLKFLPFAGVSADVLVAFIRSAFDDVDGTGGAVGGSAFVGACVGKSAFVEARYRFASRSKASTFPALPCKSACGSDTLARVSSFDRPCRRRFHRGRMI
jgi:hypothetical protein